MKVLNLYAGIGGNRKLWKNVDVTAVEYDHKIAGVYQDFFPDDKVVVGDAHQYLIDHFGEFDFIWSSPPCPTHSRMSHINHLSPYKSNKEQLKRGGWIKPRYPDMALYQEIIFLKYFFKGKYCVENVESYYKPIIPCQLVGRHYFWANFHIGSFESTPIGIGGKTYKGYDHLVNLHGIDIMDYGFSRKKAETALRNCVSSYLGLHILNEMKRDNHSELFR